MGDLEAVGFLKWVLVRVDDAMLKHNRTPPVNRVNNTDLQFVCYFCHQPINLETDLATDGRGQSLHGDCYTKQIKAEAAEQRNPSSTNAAD
jgi:hypothetical protein